MSVYTFVWTTGNLGLCIEPLMQHREPNDGCVRPPSTHLVDQSSMESQDRLLPLAVYSITVFIFQRNYSARLVFWSSQLSVPSLGVIAHIQRLHSKKASALSFALVVGLFGGGGSSTATRGGKASAFINQVFY